ncbi:MAG: hypothetical protein Q4C55_08645 [Eubacterium sp.]|nr:hypothetical protein [Eubacterium sp.]
MVKTDFQSRSVRFPPFWTAICLGLRFGAKNKKAPKRRRGVLGVYAEGVLFTDAATLEALLPEK